ncbi:MAG: GtrA family protein, partial [Actinobacteria bacterium]|nr:GtrA family protein [Actinomycetota bacterium]
DNWFFDTELLVLAERAGLRIHEVPVDWVDDPGTTVDVVATAVEDLRGVWRLAHGLATRRIPVAGLAAQLRRPDLPAALPGVPTGLPGQLLRFCAVGVASTVAYFVLYLLLRPLGAQPANLVALLLTAVANTAANRRLTFGVSGRAGALRHHLGGLAAFVAALGLTSGALWVLAAAWPTAGRWVEVAVLVVANAVATLGRFLVLRLLMNRPEVTPPSG